MKDIIAILEKMGYTDIAINEKYLNVYKGTAYKGEAFVFLTVFKLMENILIKEQ